jgi:hypothetical protein
VIELSTRQKAMRSRACRRIDGGVVADVHIEIRRRQLRCNILGRNPVNNPPPAALQPLAVINDLRAA